MNPSLPEGPAGIDLADQLIALGRGMARAPRSRGAAFYFDYQGPCQFNERDVRQVVRRAESMLAEGMDRAAPGQGSVFLNVHGWPRAQGQCQELVQVAYTTKGGRRDFQHLTAATDHARGAWRGDLIVKHPAPASVQLVAQASGPYERQEWPHDGTVLGFEATLARTTPQADGASVRDLATLSAWLIGVPSQRDAVLASRLQRDGWLVRIFPDIDAARRLQGEQAHPARPGLIVMAQQSDAMDGTLAALRQARDTWPVDCRLVLGVPPGADMDSEGPGMIDGVDIRALPFSPSDLRDFKATGLRCEAMRYQARLDLMPPSGPQRPRVLVVDDCPVNQTVAEGLLHALGYATDVVPDGRRALEYLAHHCPRAVLMDVDMPVMGGIETAERIRRHERHGQCPPLAIIATTAQDDEATCRACLRAGMNAFVPKPIMLTELAEALEESCEPQQGHA